MVAWGKTADNIEKKEEIKVSPKRQEAGEKKDFMAYFSKTRKPKAFVTLLYGDTGSGKTYTAMTFPEPVFIIDTESRAVNNLRNFEGKNVHIFCPMTMKTAVKRGESPFDEHGSIEKIEEFIINFSREVLAGKITKGTLVVDSVTDLWTWVQHWGVIELSKRLTKDGSKRADPFLMTIKNQFDWKVPNKKHYDIANVLRNLIFEGIHVVLTAREEKTPTYVKKKTVSNRDRIRSQKDIPFLADVIFRLGNVENKHMAICEKLFGQEPSNKIVESLTYEKIKEALK